jgi:hypothetical protein
MRQQTWILNLIVLTSFVYSPLAASAQIVSPETQGPYGIKENDYKLPSAEHTDILSGRQTELWARVYAPTEGSGNLPVAKMPLAVFLHGNHMTCGTGSNPRIDNNAEYTTTGTCPAGYVVTPNHRGYDYIARNLASWGYVVVSINANRGINAGSGVFGDSGLNLARGRLVLKHLEQLSQWNKNGGSSSLLGFDLKDKLDFEEVGLMGHSRGGEGMRAANHIFYAADSIWPAKIGPMNIKAIIEIGPVDGQTSLTLNAPNLAWSVLLPLCDGDVSSLEGVKPFDRMYASTTETPKKPKSTFVVWGANHNYFNTEWQRSDASGCDDHQPIFDQTRIDSPQQQKVGIYAVSGFIRAHTGKSANTNFLGLFDPLVSLPSDLTSVTNIGRDYVKTNDETTTRKLINWRTNSVSTQNGVSTEIRSPALQPDRKTLNITWSSRSDDNYVAVKLNDPIIEADETLDFSVLSRNNQPGTDFSINLRTNNGQDLAAVKIKDFLTLAKSTGRGLLQTVRIPVEMLGITSPTTIGSFVIKFNESSAGTIMLGEIRVTKNSDRVLVENVNDFATLESIASKGGSVYQSQIEAIVEHIVSSENGQKSYVTVFAKDAFIARAKIPTLVIGNKAYDLSYNPDGSADRLVFSVSTTKESSIKEQDEVKIEFR